MFTEKSRHSSEEQQKNALKKKAKGRLWRQFVLAISIFQVFNYGINALTISDKSVSEDKTGHKSESYLLPNTDAKVQDKNTSTLLNYYFE